MAIDPDDFNFDVDLRLLKPRKLREVIADAYRRRYQRFLKLYEKGPLDTVTPDFMDQRLIEYAQALLSLK